MLFGVGSHEQVALQSTTRLLLPYLVKTWTEIWMTNDQSTCVEGYPAEEVYRFVTFPTSSKLKHARQKRCRSQSEAEVKAKAKAKQNQK